MKPDTPQYLTEQQVAEATSISLSSLRNGRHERRGIPYVKFGRSVRYKLQDVIDYMEAHRIETAEG